MKKKKKFYEPAVTNSFFKSFKQIFECKKKP